MPQTLHGYNLAGARIWFKLDISGSGPGPEYAYQTVYFNGRRMAEGTHLEKQLLFDRAKPGDRALVAVKILTTQQDKRLEGADLRIGFAAGRPDPGDLEAELLSAAELLPVVTPDPSALQAQEKTLESAASAIDIPALDRQDQSAFDASLETAQAALEPLRSILRRYSVSMTGNAHIDAAWLWTWTETVDQVHFTFANALQMMNEYPHYTFAQSTTQYSEWMEEKFPRLFAEIQRRVKEGRWEMVGGMMVEPDLNMPDGESAVRQLLLGTRYVQQKFGVDVHVGWNPDSFGYTWQLPQIYKKSGIDYFVLEKMVENETNPLPLKLFWWQAPDGSRVLTYIPHDFVLEIEPVDIAANLVEAVKLNPGQTDLLHLYGPSFGRLAVSLARDVLGAGVHWGQADKVFPKMQFGTAESFFQGVETKIAPAPPSWNYRVLANGNGALPAPPSGKVAVPIWNDELYLEHHRGTYTTQAQHKRNMRESEEWLLNAEKYSALAWLGGLDYPGARLTEAWKKAAFNDFHDLAAGSGLGVIYKDAQRDYDMIHWATNEATGNALADINRHIDTQAHAGIPVMVWNPLAWDRTSIVDVSVQMPDATASGVSVFDADRHLLPSQILSSDRETNTFHVLLEAKDVPSLGYEVLHVVPGREAFDSDLQASGMTLENSLLRVVVDSHTGCITSLYDKKANFETLAAGGCGNQLQAFKDTPHKDDAWNIDLGTLDHFTPLAQADSVKLVEKGPLRGVIRVKRTWQSSTFVQDITLDAGSDEVDVVNDIDWHETHVLLKAAFPLAASSNMATYEIPYGTIERPTTRNNRWEQAKFEVPALRWADLGNGQHGFSLINESKYGYDGSGNVLRLSLLRSPVWPDPDADRGHHHFRYALYPHGGDWKSALTVRHGYEYNYRFQTMQVERHTGALPSRHSFVRLQPNNLLLTAMKKSEDGNSLILRFYEWAGKNQEAEITIPAGASAATEVNLMERGPKGVKAKPLAVSGGHYILPVGPYSINTVRIDYADRGADFWQAQRSAGDK